MNCHHTHLFCEQTISPHFPKVASDETPSCPVAAACLQTTTCTCTIQPLCYLTRKTYFSLTWSDSSILDVILETASPTFFTSRMKPAPLRADVLFAFGNYTDRTNRSQQYECITDSLQKRINCSGKYARLVCLLSAICISTGLSICLPVCLYCI